MEEHEGRGGRRRWEEEEAGEKKEQGKLRGSLVVVLEGLILGLAVLLLLLLVLVLVLLGDGLGHELLKGHVVALFVGVALGLCVAC